MIEYSNTHSVSLLLNVANKSHCPQDSLSEIVPAGHSNVGKLSFINTLLGRKDLICASSKPGKTQLLNFHNVDDKLRFVGVPGYGYARVPKSRRAKWGRMIKEYLVSHDNLRVVVSLIDFRHDPSAGDVQMYDLLKYREIPVIVVAIKTDRIPHGRWNKHESAAKKKLNFDKSDKFIIFSSADRAGLDGSWDSILDEL